MSATRTTKLDPAIMNMLRGLGKKIRVVGQIHQEREVKLPGRGKGSICDLIAHVEIDGALYALVVEEKYDQRSETTIDDWLNEPRRWGGPTWNREDHLIRIFDELEFYDLFKGKSVLHGDFLYRPFHRTYAAMKVGEPAKFKGAIMIVQFLSNDMSYLQNFSDFCSLFNIRFDQGELKRTVSPIAASKRGRSPGGKPLFIGLV